MTEPSNNTNIVPKNNEEIEPLEKKVEEEVELSQEEKAALLRIEKAKYFDGEFDKTFAKIFTGENGGFLGKISMQLSKRADFSMPTAYVGVRKIDKYYDLIMGFNPTFLRAQNEERRKGVVTHELYHVVFNHITKRTIGNPKLATLWNWATDLAINSIIGINKLPEMCLCPGHRPTDPQTGKEIEGPYAELIQNIEPLQSSEYYFKELKKLMKELGHDKGEFDLTVCAGFDSMDDHGSWDNIPEEVRDEISSKIRDMVGKAARDSDRDNTWGTVPQEIQDYIRKMVSREIDWKSIVRNFIGRVRTMERTSTIKRINKKMPYIHPGVKRKNVAKFACFIDQSGSMSDLDIAMLFGELESFAKETELDVYHFDTEIDKDSHTVWKKGREFPTAHRTRCGGTSFDCVAEFCNNRKNPDWSGIVILTDGYAPTMGGVRNAKVLWVITEGGTMDAIRPGDLAVKMASTDNKFKKY